jgi:hypothetical protein
MRTETRLAIQGLVLAAAGLGLCLERTSSPGQAPGRAVLSPAGSPPTQAVASQGIDLRVVRLTAFPDGELYADLKILDADPRRRWRVKSCRVSDASGRRWRLLSWSTGASGPDHFIHFRCTLANEGSAAIETPPVNSSCRLRIGIEQVNRFPAASRWAYTAKEVPASGLSALPNARQPEGLEAVRRGTRIRLLALRGPGRITTEQHLPFGWDGVLAHLQLERPDSNSLVFVSAAQGGRLCRTQWEGESLAGDYYFSFVPRRAGPVRLTFAVQEIRFFDLEGAVTDGSKGHN